MFQGVNAMNFGLRAKYSEIDFEGLNISDLRLVGGGCGGGGGGGGSTTVQTVQSVQSAAQAAAAAPGANSSISTAVSPSASGYITLCWVYNPGNTGTACVDGQSGHVTASSGSSSGSGFWSSVGSFFSWLFGSH
jgi:hypothetical protein